MNEKWILGLRARLARRFDDAIRRVPAEELAEESHFGWTLARFLSTEGELVGKRSQVRFEAIDLLTEDCDRLVRFRRELLRPTEAFLRDRRRNRPAQDGVDRQGQERVRRPTVARTSSSR